MGPVIGHARLTQLGFEFKEFKNKTSVYADHKWYQVPMSEGLPALTAALDLIEARLKALCAHSD